jgi:hypothetical protein
VLIRINTGLLEQIEQYQRDRHRFDEISVGADSLFQSRIAPNAHTDLGRQSSLANAYIQDDQQEAAQTGVYCSDHY